MGYFDLNPEVKRFPPDQTSILNLTVEPLSDLTRIRILIEITPFEQPPTIELILYDFSGQVVASTLIVEPPFWRHDLIMHLKDPEISKLEYKLVAQIIYPDQPIRGQKSLSFFMDKMDSD